MNRAPRALLFAVLYLGAFATPAAAVDPRRVWTLHFADLAAVDTLEAHGRTAAGRAWLDSVLAAGSRAPGTLRLHALLRRGRDRVVSGDMEGARQDLGEGLRIAAARRDTVASMLAYQSLLAGTTTRGDFATSDSLLGRLMILARRSGSLSFQGQGLILQAYMMRNRGHAREAIAPYERAVRLLLACGDTASAMRARIGIANVSYEVGDLERARRAYVAVLEEARRAHEPYVEPVALNGLAVIEINLNHPEVALAESELADRLFRRTANYDGWMRTATVRISILELMHRRADMERELLAFRQDAERHHDPSMIAWGLSRLAVFRAEQGRTHEALSLARELEARKDSFPEEKRGRFELRVADTYAESGEPKNALVRYERLAASRVPDLGVRLEATTGACRMLITLGRPREALIRLAAAPLRVGATSFAEWEVDSAEVSARAYSRLNRPDSAAACLRRAIEGSERQRAGATTAEWREADAARRSELLTEYAIHLLGPRGGAPSEARIRTAFDELERHRALTFRERLARNDARAARRPEASGVTIDALQRSVLREDEVLVEYFLSDTGGVMLVVDRRSARVRWLPAVRDLGSTESLALGWLSTPGTDAGERDRALAELRRILIGDLGPGLAGHRLLIVADGKTSEVPFSSLLAGHDAGAVPEWTLVPSATVLAMIRFSPPSRPPRSMLALAAERAANGAALEGARKEVEGLAREFERVDTRLARGGTTVAALVKRLGEYEVVHLAGHGKIDTEAPWRSGILLDPGYSSTDYVRGTDVAGLSLDTRLCVLSSCSSAGVPMPGEGMGGLSSAFLVAGVPTVIATLWPVDDRATAQLMRVFYRSLARGAVASAALRDAQGALRERSETRAPFYWAGFVLLGAPETSVHLRRR